jgi:uncharacterized protein
LSDWRAAVASLSHPLVRALAWSIGSPAPFNPSEPAWRGGLADARQDAQWLAAALPWLQQLERQPSELARLLPPGKSRPLGKSFELLIGYWLAQRADIAWVQPSLVVRRAGRTMGEFDHVYADLAGQLHSLELTVKFYLRIAPELGSQGYVGPMVYDFMEHKVARMTAHQMPLGDTKDGQQAIKACLTRRGIAHDPDAVLPVRAHALARGYLFEPYDGATATLPAIVNPQHLKGAWLTTLDMDKHPQASAPIWKVLDNIEWLGPQRADEQSLISLAQCAERMTKVRHLMIGRYAQTGASPLWEEVERLMLITPDAQVLSAPFATQRTSVELV